MLGGLTAITHYMGVHECVHGSFRETDTQWVDGRSCSFLEVGAA